jgi:hypothetical protein
MSGAVPENHGIKPQTRQRLLLLEFRQPMKIKLFQANPQIHLEIS